MRLLNIKDVQNMQLELMKKLHNFMQSNNLNYYLIAGSSLGAARHKGFIPWDDDIDIGLFREDYERFIKLSSSFSKEYEVVNYRNCKKCDFGLTRIYLPHTYIENPSIKNTILDQRLYFDIFPLDNVPDDIKELNKFEKEIITMKKLVQRIDVRNNNNSIFVLFCKKIISLCLTPLRTYIIALFDRLCQKYIDIDSKCVCSLFSQYSFKRQVIPKEVYGVPTLHVFETEQFYVPERLDTYLTILYGPNYYEVPPIEKRRKGFKIYSIKEV